MKQLNKTQSAIFVAGGVLMVVGAGCYAFMWHRELMCWVYLVGAVMFAIMQVMQTYEGTNATIKRLKKIMTTADIFFVLSGFLMVDSAYMFFRTFFSDYNTYLQYVFNKWVLLLLVASVLEVYTMHRISSELGKDESSD